MICNVQAITTHAFSYWRESIHVSRMIEVEHHKTFLPCSQIRSYYKEQFYSNGVGAAYHTSTNRVLSTSFLIHLVRPKKGCLVPITLPYLVFVPYLKVFLSILLKNELFTHKNYGKHSMQIITIYGYPKFS